MRLTATLSAGLNAILVLLASESLTGCATVPIDKARSEFYAGRFAQAETILTPLPDEDTDQVLFLMERGMARQAMGRYEESSRDWRDASEKNELLETYSVSRGAASLLTNDRILSFRGKPYERTLLFAFLAKNYLAEQNWDYAAICARNIIGQLESREGFPDSAYCRYMAGLCLEMIGDTGNAALQYRTASELTPALRIDEHSGMISVAPKGATGDAAKADHSDSFQLACFVGMGSAAPPGSGIAIAGGRSVTADFYQGDVFLGQCHELDNTWDLAEKTRKQIELLQLTKEASRIAIKESIARTVEQQNDLLGFLTRLTLFALETPDRRMWRMLPLRLSVARLICPAPVSSYRVVFKDAAGNAVLAKTVASPISRRGNVFISFCRDIPDSELKEPR